MSYVNCGAMDEELGARVKTKKALKEAIASHPDKVYFDGTSAMGPQFSGYANKLPQGTKLSVVGPDPYTSRKWYATVEVSAQGKIKVS